VLESWAFEYFRRKESLLSPKKSNTVILSGVKFAQNKSLGFGFAHTAWRSFVCYSCAQAQLIISVVKIIIENTNRAQLINPGLHEPKVKPHHPTSPK
jgi:hypothetical protein